MIGTKRPLDALYALAHEKSAHSLHQVSNRTVAQARPETCCDRAFHSCEIGLAFIAEEIDGAFSRLGARGPAVQGPCAEDSPCAEDPPCAAVLLCAETEPCAAIGLMSFKDLNTLLPQDLGCGDTTFLCIDSS